MRTPSEILPLIKRKREDTLRERNAMTVKSGERYQFLEAELIRLDKRIKELNFAVNNTERTLTFWSSK